MKVLAKLVSALVCVILSGSAHSALLFEHQFGNGPTNQACSSCLPQLNRVWDAFDLESTSAVTSIEALLGLDASYPAMGSTPINFSVWTFDRSTSLFSQNFLPSQLGITSLGGSRFDVVANLSGLVLPSGTYYLSIYNGSQVDALGWNVSPATVDGRSIQTLGDSMEPLPPDRSASGRDMAFRVFGDARLISEPGTLTLLVVVLLLTRGRALHRSGERHRRH